MTLLIIAPLTRWSLGTHDHLIKKTPFTLPCLPLYWHRVGVPTLLHPFFENSYYPHSIKTLKILQTAYQLPLILEDLELWEIHPDYVLLGATSSHNHPQPHPKTDTHPPFYLCLCDETKAPKSAHEQIKLLAHYRSSRYAITSLTLLSPFTPPLPPRRGPRLGY